MLTAQYITGFVEGEGCFTVSVSKQPALSTGYQVAARFCINLGGRDRALLDKVKTFFGCGEVFPRKDGGAQYQVDAQEDVATKIIPHFDQYPLYGAKLADFATFKEIFDMIQRKEHLTKDGVNKIIDLRAGMNSENMKTKIREHI